MGSDDKRKQILDAAVRVFARQGYESSPVGDVAKEAGVAYGLVYHYYGSKDAVLEAVFREAWGRLLAAVALAEETGETRPSSSRSSSRSSCAPGGTIRTSSACSCVRSPAAPTSRTSSTRSARRSRASSASSAGGRRKGRSAPASTPRLAAWMLYGALEEVLTGWVLGQLADDAERVSSAEREVIASITGGLQVRPD